MSTDSLAVVLHGKDDLRVEAFELPLKVGPSEARVHVHSVGVCGTDIHMWKSGCLVTEQAKLPKPMVLGHETSGTVVEVGSDVTKVKVGDRVHVRPAKPCYKCSLCQMGKSNACRSVHLEKHAHGSMRREMKADESMLYILPDHISFAEGAMLEPFTVGVYACEKGQVQPGHTMLIVGAGCVGVMTLLAARVTGAVKICVVDIVDEKLEFAKKEGATHTVLASRSPEETAQRVREAMGCEPDIAIDCSGSEPGINTCIYAVRPCGKVVIAGLAPQKATLPMMLTAINEIDLLALLRFGQCYDKGYNLMVSGKVNLKSTIGKTFPLSQALEAFKEMEQGIRTGGIKCIVECEQ